MDRVRNFHIYDLAFFLSKKSTTFCFNNWTRFTNNQAGQARYLFDFFGLISTDVTAVCLDTARVYYWGAQIDVDSSLPSAWINWLMAGEKADNVRLPLLLEYLIQEAGEAQKKTLAVILDEGHWFSAAFRQVGFAVISKQTIWKMHLPDDLPYPDDWQEVVVQPFNEFDLFYQSQIPPLLRQLGSNWKSPRIYALKKDNQVVACAKVETDKNNVYIEPIFHPVIENPGKALIHLAASVSTVPDSELRVAVPGFQAWMTESMLNEGFQLDTRQIVFVKNLTEKAHDTVPSFLFEQNALQPIRTHQVHTIKKAK